MKLVQRPRARIRKYFRVDFYARMLPYVRPYKAAMVFVLIMQLVYTSIGLLDPWPMKIVIDQGLSGKPMPPWMRSVLSVVPWHSAMAIIVMAVGGGLLISILKNVIDVGTDYVKSRVNTGMSLRFTADLFNHLQRLSFSYHDRTTVGDSIYRINNDTGFVSTLVWSNFRHLITAVVTFVGMLWILLKLDWVLTLVALAVGPAQYVGILFYGKLFKDKSKRVRAMESVVQSIVQEVFSCLRVVKAFGQEEREQRRFESQAWTAVRARLHLELQRGFFTYAMNWIGKIDRAAILLIGAFHVLRGHLTIGELFVIQAYVDRIQEPLGAIGDVLTNMQGSLVSAERAFEVLDIEPEVRDKAGARTLDRLEGAVAFERVSFGYEPGRPVLHEIGFTVRPGEITALVGPTGAGKTTIASLIARFYDPASGRVLLDGHDARELTVRTLRDNIAIVLQEPILFSCSIRENIAYGRPDASFDEIVQAAKAANAHDFISALQEGYESTVGERGARLSGGERQRLSVARAFLMDAPILILDEPTSSVDSRTEVLILEALDRLMAGRTTFVIAHRLSTVRRASQILAIENGRVVERGTHSELLAINGLYAQLHQIQIGGFQDQAVAVPA